LFDHPAPSASAWRTPAYGSPRRGEGSLNIGMAAKFEWAQPTALPPSLRRLELLEPADRPQSRGTPACSHVPASGLHDDTGARMCGGCSLPLCSSSPMMLWQPQPR
jgi:hypothetical protein